MVRSDRLVPKRKPKRRIGLKTTTLRSRPRPPVQEDSWLLKLIEPRSIGFFIFAASIFAIEFNEMWAVNVPRTVALSKFDILSSSIANIPVLIVAVLAAALLIAALAVLFLIGWGGIGAALSISFLIILGLWDFISSTIRWALGNILAQFMKGRAPAVSEPSFGLFSLSKTERFKEASNIFWASINSARGGARKALSIISRRPRRGSWEQFAQIGVTVVVFFVIWMFSWLSAERYEQQIYGFKLAEERGACGPKDPPKFPSLGFLFELFQPLDAGYLVLNKDFSARSTLIKHVNATIVEAEEKSDEASSVVVTGCVTYVGDYGEWAFLVPRHKEIPPNNKSGFLIRRSTIQEFTPVPPDGSGRIAPGNLKFPTSEKVLASLTKEVADLRKAVNENVLDLLPAQVAERSSALAGLRQTVTALDAKVNSPEGFANPLLERLIAENGEAIAALKAEIATLARQLEIEAASSERLQTLEETTGLLSEDVRRLSAEISQFTGGLASLDERTSAIGGRLDQHSVSITGLAAGMGALSAKLDDADDVLGSLAKGANRIERELTTGLLGQQAAVSGLKLGLERLSEEVRGLADQGGQALPEGALTALKQDVAALSETLAILSATVTPLAPRLDGLALEVKTLDGSQNYAALTASIADLRAELAAIKALMPGIPDPEHKEALLRLIETMDERIVSLEDGPTVVVVNGGGGGTSLPWDDQYGGVPTRLVDAIDQVKGLGGRLSECYREGKPTDHINFARNEIALTDGPKVASLLKTVASALDLPNRDASSTAKLVFLKGGADSLGTPEVNRRISEQRAAAVQRAIEDHLGAKLDGKNIELVSAGIGENVAILNSDRSIGARAVEVIICDAGAK